MGFYIRKNLKNSLIVWFLQIVIWGIQSGLQIVLMLSFDAAIQRDLIRFLKITLVNLAIWGIYFALIILLEKYQNKLIAKLNNQVRMDYLAGIYELDYLDYKETDSGKYLSWISNDIKQMERLAWRPCFDRVGRISQILTSIVCLAVIDIGLLFVALIVSFIMWIIPKAFNGRMKYLGNQNSSKHAEALEKLKDIIQGMSIFKVFNREPEFYLRGFSAGEQIEQSNYNLNYTQAKVSALIGFVNVFLQLATEVLIFSLAIAGKFSLGVLGGGTNLVSGITNGFDNLSRFRLSLSASEAYFEKIKVKGKFEEVADLVAMKESNAPEHDLTRENAKYVKFKSNIVLRDVSYSYGNKNIISGLSFTFHKGRKYALVGKSGSGKTTLLRILMGWLTDYKGSVMIDGNDINDIDRENLANIFGYVDQDVYLFNGNIIENITLGIRFSQDVMEKVLKRSSLCEDLSKMEKGLLTEVGEGGCFLSGGQRQRIAIARALIFGREVLLVDEGTNSLDKMNRNIIESSLLDNQDITLIYITHHLDEEMIERFDGILSLD